MPVSVLLPRRGLGVGIRHEQSLPLALSALPVCVNGAYPLDIKIIFDLVGKGERREK